MVWLVVGYLKDTNAGEWYYYVQPYYKNVWN